MTQFKRNPLAAAVSAAITGSVLVAAAPAQAQQSTAALEEIIVTAQKREENLQDVAVSVQVLGNTQIEQLNLNNFADYIEFLPTVSFQSQRPGVSQVYMRGISSGGDGVHSGSMPSVGVYLDERTGDLRPVVVRQANILATSFHPELTDDTRVHEMLMTMVEER